MKKLIICLMTLYCFFATVIVYAEDNAKTINLGNVVLKDMLGKTHKLSQYRGKWLIINYWATWCPPCLEEMPDLVGLYDQRKSDVMVLGIVFDYESPQEVTKFVDDMLVSYPIVLGDMKIASQLGVADVMPTTYIYSPNGVLVKTKRGAVTREYLEKIIAAK